jgi:CubicO group peptidase (beta-lactamase class C family)
VSRETLEKFTKRAGVVAGSSRALGWDTPSANSSAGDLFSPRSFGHTGYTGTSMWIDPERGLFAILLTNRVHPTRENTAIFPVRRAFADAVAGGLENP